MAKTKVLDIYGMRMLKSCFTYSDYGRYYQALIEKYGKKLIEKELKKLQNNYKINCNVYTDSEGVSYNQLVEK